MYQIVILQMTYVLIYLVKYLGIEFADQRTVDFFSNENRNKISNDKSKPSLKYTK